MPRENSELQGDKIRTWDFEVLEDSSLVGNAQALRAQTMYLMIAPKMDDHASRRPLGIAP